MIDNEDDGINTSECLTIIPCFARDDIKKKEGFKQEYTYQIFGEDETIEGFDNLKIYIYYTPITFKFHIKIEHDSPESDSKIIFEKFKENTLVDYLEDNEFLLHLDEMPKNQTLIGVQKEEFQVNGETFLIHYVDNLDTEEVSLFHKVYHFFAIGYIEGANEIDLKDDGWRFMICYKKMTNLAGQVTYDLAGIYSLYVFKILSKIRPRISVAFVLPPYRRMGIASKLLSNIYNIFSSQENVIDISVETPVDDFQSMRHSVDCKLISRVNGCKEIFKFCSENNKFDIDQFRKAYKDFVDLNVKNYKFNRQQRLKVFILLSFIMAKRKKVCEDVVYQFFLKKMKLKKKGPKEMEEEGNEQLLSVVNYFREIAFKLKIDTKN